MIPTHPRNIILSGFVLVLLGVLIPLGMIIGFIESTFFLNFFSYVASFFGLILGIIGLAFYTRIGKK